MDTLPQPRCFTLPSFDGAPIRCDAYVPAGAGPFPAVIAVHGFKGFKDWGSMPTIGRRLAEEGFVCVAFNFSHNGIGEALTQFTELDKFAANTLSRELDELGIVIDAVASGAVGLPVDPARIALYGHSRGGGESIIAAAEHSVVRAVCTWGTVAYFDRWTERQKKRWREKGAMEILNARTGELMRMDATYLDDLEQHAPRLAIRRAASTLACPMLLVHGEQDLTVLADESARIASIAGPSRARLAIVANTGHTFGAEHPFAGMTAALAEALKITIAFFRETLGA